jgi:hypothetical protein
MNSIMETLEMKPDLIVDYNVYDSDSTVVSETHDRHLSDFDDVKSKPLTILPEDFMMAESPTLAHDSPVEQDSFLSDPDLVGNGLLNQYSALPNIDLNTLPVVPLPVPVNLHGEKPCEYLMLRCETCNTIMVGVEDLKTHSETPDIDHNYMCLHCNRTFTAIIAILEHVSSLSSLELLPTEGTPERKLLEKEDYVEQDKITKVRNSKSNLDEYILSCCD